MALRAAVNMQRVHQCQGGMWRRYCPGTTQCPDYVTNVALPRSLPPPAYCTISLPNPDEEPSHISAYAYAKTFKALLVTLPSQLQRSGLDFISRLRTMPSIVILRFIGLV